jgi:hypothetical protein
MRTFEEFAAKERIVKLILRALRSSRLPIWRHTGFIIATIFMLWGKILYVRLFEEQIWETRGDGLFKIISIATLGILVVWLLSAFGQYCAYRQFPIYVKIVSTARLTEQYIWRGFITLVLILAALGVIFGVGT